MLDNFFSEREKDSAFQSMVAKVVEHLTACWTEPGSNPSGSSATCKLFGVTSGSVFLNGATEATWGEINKEVSHIIVPLSFSVSKDKVAY